MAAEPSTDQSRQCTFTWSDPAATAAAAARVSLRRAGRGCDPTAADLRTLDFDGVSFAEGRAAFRLTPQEFHYSPLGTVHGGVFATLIDSACSCAIHTMLPAGVFSVQSRSTPGRSPPRRSWCLSAGALRWLRGASSTRRQCTRHRHQ